MWLLMFQNLSDNGVLLQYIPIQRWLILYWFNINIIATLSTLHETLDSRRDVGGKRSPCRLTCAGANDVTTVQAVSDGSRYSQSESVTPCWETPAELHILVTSNLWRRQWCMSYMGFQLMNWIREDFSVPSNHREVRGSRSDDYSNEKWTSKLCCSVRLVSALGVEYVIGPALQMSHGHCMVNTPINWSCYLTDGRLCTGRSQR